MMMPKSNALLKARCPLQIRAAPSQRRYQQWLTSAIKMMIGIGTPSRKSKIERIVKSPQFV
jgi:hypothetical protein